MSANSAGSPRREGHLRAQRLVDRLGHAVDHRGVEDARRDRHHAHADAGELARQRQGHADHAAFAGRVGSLPDLAFPGRDGGGEGDHPALAVGIGLVVLHQVRGGLGDVEAADEVDAYRGGEGVERHRAFAPERASRAQDAGAADRRVEAAHLLPRLRQRDFRRGLAGYVQVDVTGGFAQLDGGGVALFIIEIEQGDVATVGDDAPGRGQPEAGGTAGDNGADITGFHRAGSWENARGESPALYRQAHCPVRWLRMRLVGRGYAPDERST